ncbi:MAG: EamA family transporter [Acidimicrobiales bacterium]
MAPARTAASWAPALIMAGAVTQYLGAALAVHAFATLGAAAVAWLRVAWSAALLLAWRRPRRRAFDRSRLRTLAAFGTALAVMNLAFYLAIDRLPLGTAVAIEFSGPISVAALGSRRRRDLLAVVLAGAGVVLLADVQWQANALGVVFALGAAAMWAGYIVWGRRVGAGGAVAGLDGLAVATLVGAVVIAPVGIAGLAGLDRAADRPSPALGAALAAVALCVVVALCSNVVPYALDQVVLAHVPAAQFALLSSLLPVTALAVGAVVLAQTPTAVEVVGVGLVVAGLLSRSRTAPVPPVSGDPPGGDRSP